MSDTSADKSSNVERSNIDTPNTFFNALIGAVISLVASPMLPFATIVGGMVAGYLQGTDLREGGLVGGLSGGIALIPLFFFMWLFIGIALIGSVRSLFVFGLIGIFAVLFMALYFIGAGALGGVLGSYIKQEV
ncbi:MAG: DUF5518 domain-containing protein [Halobacteriaceae archaeon]